MDIYIYIYVENNYSYLCDKILDIVGLLVCQRRAADRIQLQNSATKPAAAYYSVCRCWSLSCFVSLRVSLN